MHLASINNAFLFEFKITSIKTSISFERMNKFQNTAYGYFLDTNYVFSGLAMTFEGELSATKRDLDISVIELADYKKKMDEQSAILKEYEVRIQNVE